MSDTIASVFQEVKTQLAGLKAISAVEIDTGLPYSVLAVDPAFDLEAASAYNAEVLKTKIRAKDAMGMTDEKVEMMMVELTHQIHVILPTDDGKSLIYMAADRASANLGIVRKVMAEASRKIQAIIAAGNV